MRRSFALTTLLGLSLTLAACSGDDSTQEASDSPASSPAPSASSAPKSSPPESPGPESPASSSVQNSSATDPSGTESTFTAGPASEAEEQANAPLTASDDAAALLGLPIGAPAAIGPALLPGSVSTVRLPKDTSRIWVACSGEGTIATSGLRAQDLYASCDEGPVAAPVTLAGATEVSFVVSGSEEAAVAVQSRSDVRAQAASEREAADRDDSAARHAEMEARTREVSSLVEAKGWARSGSPLTGATAGAFGQDGLVNEVSTLEEPVRRLVTSARCTGGGTARLQPVTVGEDPGADTFRLPALKVPCDGAVRTTVRRLTEPARTMVLFTPEGHGGTYSVAFAG